MSAISSNKKEKANRNCANYPPENFSVTADVEEAIRADSKSGLNAETFNIQRRTSKFRNLDVEWWALNNLEKFKPLRHVGSQNFGWRGQTRRLTSASQQHGRVRAVRAKFETRENLKENVTAMVKSSSRPTRFSRKRNVSAAVQLRRITIERIILFSHRAVARLEPVRDPRAPVFVHPIIEAAREGVVGRGSVGREMFKITGSLLRR